MLKRLITGACLGLIVPLVASIAVATHGGLTLAELIEAHQYLRSLWLADIAPVITAIGWYYAAAEPSASLNSRSRELPLIIGIITVIPVALLIYTATEARESKAAMNEVEVLADIRAESYGVFYSSNGLGPAVAATSVNQLQTDIDRMRKVYASDFKNLAPAWAIYQKDLLARGKVTYAVASNLATQADAYCDILNAQTDDRANLTNVLLTLGFLCLLLFFVKCYKILGHIRSLEKLSEWTNKELEIRNDQLERQKEELRGREEQLELNAESLSDVNELLQQASHRFEELFQSLPVACFCFDSDGRIFEWNRASEAQYGLTTELVFQRTLWETIGRPEDVERIQDMTRRVFMGEVLEGVEWDHRRNDGSPCRVLSSTFPLCGSDGAIVGAISANVDISDLKRTQLNLRDSEERFRSALHSMQEGMLLIDSDLKVCLSNQTAERIFGMDDNTLYGRNVKDLGWNFVYEDGTAASIGNWPGVMTLEGGIAHHEVVMGLLKPGGKLAWLSMNCAPLFRSESIKPYAVVVTVTDITQRKHYEQKVKEQMVMLNDAHAKLEIQQAELLEANAKLRALATLDGLTGLKNHRAFQERMESEMQRAIRYTIPLSLILLDVDKFKVFNDTFGHPAGDEVLKTVAKVLQQEARVTDFVARYGGEEFAIILTNTDYSGALVVAERIRAAIESAQWQNHVITASFGITTMLPHQHTAADLITQADRSLYYSKDHGRNCATHIFHVLDEEIRQSDAPIAPSTTQRRRIAA